MPLVPLAPGTILVVYVDGKRRIPEVGATRLLPVESHDATIDGTGIVAVGDAVIVPVSQSAQGLPWFTTSGLGRYGLPDLSLEGAPSGAERVATHLVMSAAQSIVEAMLAALERASEPESGVALPDLLEVTRAHL